MALPNVKITTANGNLGRAALSADGIAALLLTGVAIDGKVDLNKPYQISSTIELAALGITGDTNALAYKEIVAFYAQAGQGAELYFMLVSPATTLEDMCSEVADSPLRKIVEAGGGRIRLVGINKLAPEGYLLDATQGIDADSILAAASAQKVAEDFANKINPFRVFLAAPGYDSTVTDMYKPRQGSYNRVAFVLASDHQQNKTAAVGQVLGRAAKQPASASIARVKDGVMAAQGWLTNGKTSKEMAGKADILHDAGYIIYRHYPSKNGVYLNDDPMAAPVTDDYSQLNLGRVIDKAIILAYDTYIGEIMDNISVDPATGKLPQGVCLSYQSMIENAVASTMSGQISAFTAYIDPAQNLLSTSELKVVCSITPLATLRSISVTLGFANPAISNS